MNDILLDLQVRYSEPDRHYHTLAHIGKMFDCAKDANIKLSEEQIWAVWFHDAIYDVKDPSQNEYKSAQLAFSYIYNFNGALSAKVVETIILDTKHHVPSCSESGDVIDMDLAGFLSYETIVSNHEPLHLENAHLNRQTFSQKCIKWLEMMSGRERIYHGFLCNRSNNDLARDNMKKYIETLKAME